MRSLCWISICLAAVVCVGCGSSEKVAKQYPVSGKVTKGGQPLAGCTVIFVAINQAPDAQPGYEGVIGSDGSYSLKDVVHNTSGAATGKYKITLIGSKDDAKAAMMSGAKGPPPSPFPPEYATASTSKKEVEVKAESNTINIEI